VFRVTDNSTVSEIDSIAKRLSMDKPCVSAQMQGNKRIIGTVEPAGDLEDRVRYHSKGGLVVD
jgi:hypothetical protein